VSEDQPEYRIEPSDRPVEVSVVANELTIYVGELLFEFYSFQNWVNTAQSKFRSHGFRRSDDCLCVDAKGRIVSRGEHFRRAMEQDSFPVKVYVKDV
jgi:hypothetical protein